MALSAQLGAAHEAADVAETSIRQGARFAEFPTTVEAAWTCIEFAPVF